jgi:hypothetical protein
MSQPDQGAEGDGRYDDLAARFAEKMCSAWEGSNFNLPAEPMLRALVIHGALSLAVRLGGESVAKDLRDLASRLEADFGQVRSSSH